MTLLGFLFLLFFVMVSIGHAATSTVPAGNITTPAVFAFGDSNMDTGNNNYIATLAKANFPPYGQDFMGGKATGRFNNGKVLADLFAEVLEIKELLPPCLDPSLKEEDLVTGVDFASGGTGYDPLTYESARVLSPSDQLRLLEEYVVKLEGIVGEERRSEIMNNSLFLAVCGSNDITNTYFGIPIRQLQYNVSSYSDLLVSYASIFVKGLYRAGARRIGVFGVLPVGCLPSQRTLAGGLQRSCVQKYNEATQVFNSKLSAELNSLNASLPGAVIVYIDTYNFMLDLFLNPAKYGFEIADRGCCGTGTVEVTFLCSSRAQACSNVSEYVFWDTFHPTEKAYALLVRHILTQYRTFFF